MKPKFNWKTYSKQDRTTTIDEQRKVIPYKIEYAPCFNDHQDEGCFQSQYQVYTYTTADDSSQQTASDDIILYKLTLIGSIYKHDENESYHSFGATREYVPKLRYFAVIGQYCANCREFTHNEFECRQPRLDYTCLYCLSSHHSQYSCYGYSKHQDNPVQDGRLYSHMDNYQLDMEKAHAICLRCQRPGHINCQSISDWDKVYW